MFFVGVVGGEGLKVNLGNSEVLVLNFGILSKFRGYLVTTAQLTNRFCGNNILKLL